MIANDVEARGSLLDLVRAARPASHETLKPLPVQLYEMAQLRLRRGIGPRYYLTAGLNRANRHGDAVFGHINADEYRRFVRRLNPPARRDPLNSKVEQKRRLTAAGIPTPAPIYGAEPGEADAAAFAAALAPHVGERVAVKPTSSFAGQGFRSCTVVAQGDGVALADGDGGTLSPAGLIAAMGGGLMVETYLRQHPWYAAVNASSVNTWRIWVMKPAGGGGAEAILAYLRMGRAGSAIDNMGGGGLYAPLRPDRRLGAGGDGGIFRRRFAAHPDSGVPLEDVEPPFVGEAIALAERALDAVPALAFAGMDVAVAPDGPVIIEINAEPDRMGAARVGLPFKRWLADRGIAV
jgi:hypothetical protein